VLNKPLSEWASKIFEPIFNFRTKHDVFLYEDDSKIDILFIPCGNNLLKRWPEAHWSDLLNLFSKGNSKIGIIVGYAEKDLFPNLSRLENIKVYSEISPRKIAALCKNSSLVIANDCGPMHIAAASGANLIAIFGPTNPRCWFAYSGAHRKCVQKGTGANILGILTETTTWDDWPTPDDIWITAKNIIENENSKEKLKKEKWF
jgi:ADP-heptose:LPS heptosyltransferase